MCTNYTLVYGGEQLPNKTEIKIPLMQYTASVIILLLGRDC